MQLSVCISYIYFIAVQLDRVVCHYTDGSIDDLGNVTCNPGGTCYCGHSKMYMALLTIPALPVSWIETYTILSYSSMFGICMAMIGMIIMFGILGDKLANGEEVQGEIKVFSPLQFFGNIGVAMFVFEGNAVVINVRSEAKNPKTYGKILTSAIITVILLFMVFSTFGYIVYRDETNPIFTLNLVPINGLITFVLFCVCINAFVSYPIQILAAFDIAEQHAFFKTGTKSMKKTKSVVFRSLVICLASGVAMLIPDFTTFLDIAGAIGAGVVAFILPPLMYNTQFKDTISPTSKYFNYFLVGFGIVGCIISIGTSISNIIKET